MNSFVEVATFILSKHQGLYRLSEKLSQDPLENYLGKQRQRGGRNENPSVKQCLDNADALRIQGSMALDPVRGTCRKRLSEIDEQSVIEESVQTPLPKRKKKHQ